MNKNNNEVGLQLFPVILVAASVFYYALGNTALSVWSIIMAIVMWSALFGKNVNKRDDE